MGQKKAGNWYYNYKTASKQVDACPICSGPKVGNCRCSSRVLPHTLEDLQKGHGMICANGHHFTRAGLSWDPKNRTAGQARCECGGTYSLASDCGAYVCSSCNDHRGLERCYCGWSKTNPGHGREELEGMGETIDPD